MKKKTQIISTNLSFHIKENNNYLIFGSWCISKKKNLGKFVVHKNRWSDTNLVFKDYNYIKKIFNRLQKQLPHFFNSYHNTKYNKKFWQTAIWIWLCHYLPSIFFKWKTAESLINKNKNKGLIFYSIIDDQNLCCYDTFDFYKFISTSDYFNEYFFTKIIKNFTTKVEIKRIFKKNISNKNKNIIKKKNYKLGFIKKLFFTFSNLIISKSKFINDGGFSFKNLLKLQLKRLNFPIIVEKEFRNSKNFQMFCLSDKQANKRKEFKIDINPKNNFEKFLAENISQDIPVFFLENFKKELNHLSNLNLNPKLIISSNQHYYNDKYKIWVLLKKIFSKTKISIIEHGGNHTDLNWTFGYDQKFGDDFFSWHKSKNIKNMPVPKYIGLNIKKPKQKNNLVYCGYEPPKYPSKINSSHYGLENVPSLQNLIEIKHKLNKKIYKNFFYCEKNFDDLRIKKELIDIIGRNKIKKSGTFQKQLLNSKLMICDYPQTTFFDCILRGPTVLIFDYEKNWQPEKKLIKLYNKLETGNLIFRNIDSAITFINNNWCNIYEWWGSSKISDLRKEITQEFCIKTNSDGLLKWDNYIKSNLK